MVPKVNALHAFNKTAAVSGIVLVCVNFTVEALKMAWYIISTSQEEKTWKPVSKVMCEECHEFFIYDEDELEDGKYICWTCPGI